LEKGEMMKQKDQETMQQIFVANRDGLTQVQVLLRSPGLEKNSHMKMRLLDETCMMIIRENNLRNAFIDSNNLFTFKFSRLADSANKTFCLQATLEPKDAKSVRFYTTTQKYFSYPAENITTGEKIDGQFLSIRPVYKNAHLWQDLGELNQRMSQYKPFFLKHGFLSLITIAFLVLSVGLVVVLITV